MKILTPNLSQEQVDIIVQALLFSASADICADWQDEDLRKMLATAKYIMTKCNLDKETLDIKNIFLYGEKPYEQDLSETLPEDFGVRVRQN